MSPARTATALLAVCCLLAGCGAFAGPTPAPTGEPTSARPPAEPTPEASPTPSPDTDRLGWEAGYAAADPLSVNASDGLNASEREAVVARTMARVELIRGLEFEEAVPVEVREALFLAGEGENATDAVEAVFGGGVVGYYSRGRIVLVSDDASPRVDTGTLSHELVHALQDQHFDRSHDVDTFDRRVAVRGLTEGDPRYVERTYRSRCADDWSCLPGPRGAAPDGDAVARHPGVYLAFVQPYTTGPDFVGALRERSGGDWSAVDAFRVSRTGETVTVVNAPTVEALDEVHAPTATIHVMLWANGFVPREDDLIATDYDHRLSAGWDGDTLVAYADSTGRSAAEGAYVWRIVWANESEARAFVRAYRTMLLLRLGGSEIEPGTFVTEDEPFVDAFRVSRTGETVTVVNAPTVEALDEVHAPTAT
ncbi:hypothetical protein BRC93_08260, partial [Halobacteriales archaeon QS_5_70_15]